MCDCFLEKERYNLSPDVNDGHQVHLTNVFFFQIQLVLHVHFFPLILFRENDEAKKAFHSYTQMFFSFQHHEECAEVRQEGTKLPLGFSCNLKPTKCKKTNNLYVYTLSSCSEKPETQTNRRRK